MVTFSDAYSIPEIDNLLDEEGLRTLSDIAFMAYSRGLLKEAQTLFAGLLAAKPKMESAIIGSSIVELALGRVDESINILKAAPPSHAVCVFMGMAYFQKGDLMQAMSYFEHVKESAAKFSSNQDDSCSSLASAIIEGLTSLEKTSSMFAISEAFAKKPM